MGGNATSRTKAFGQPVERLTDLAARYVVDLEAAEALALGAIVRDPTVDAQEFVAFLLWRSIGSLKAACRNDSAFFQQALREAARLDRAGIV